MKILIVLDSFYPNVDGPIAVMVNLAKEYMKAGHSVELLVPNYKEKVEIEGLKIHRCFSVHANEDYRAGLPALDRKVKKLLKKGGFDLIHLHSPFTIGKYALKQGHKCGIPVVITVHTKFRDELEKRLKSKALINFVQRYIIKCIDGCDAVTTVSYGMVDTLKDYGSKRCGEVKVIPNGTDMKPASVDPASVLKLREDLGITDKFAFAYAGRLSEVKNIQFSIRALAAASERGFENFKFIIIGDGAYEKTLKKLSAELGIRDKTVFVGRIVDKGRLAEYYAACDALLFPSVFDNASIVILEAAANGLPCAAIKGSCSAERIEDGVSGFVWENDLEAWTEGIIKLLKEPSVAQKAGEGAQDKVYVGWNKIAGEYLELYRTLIESGKPQGK